MQGSSRAARGRRSPQQAAGARPSRRRDHRSRRHRTRQSSRGRQQPSPRRGSQRRSLLPSRSRRRSRSSGRPPGRRRSPSRCVRCQAPHAGRRTTAHRCCAAADAGLKSAGGRRCTDRRIAELSKVPRLSAGRISCEPAHLQPPLMIAGQLTSRLAHPSTCCSPLYWHLGSCWRKHVVWWGSIPRRTAFARNAEI